jgi:hypothetical protein
MVSTCLQVRRITKRKEHQHQQGQGNNAHLEQVWFLADNPDDILAAIFLLNCG